MDLSGGQTDLKNSRFFDTAQKLVLILVGQDPNEENNSIYLEAAPTLKPCGFERISNMIRASQTRLLDITKDGRTTKCKKRISKDSGGGRLVTVVRDRIMDVYKVNDVGKISAVGISSFLLRRRVV